MANDQYLNKKNAKALKMPGQQCKRLLEILTVGRIITFIQPNIKTYNLLFPIILKEPTHPSFSPLAL
jgi:hypothetical protein